MPINDANMRRLPFSFTILTEENLPNIPARIRITDGDRNKPVTVDEEFMVTASYNIGRPAVLTTFFYVELSAETEDGEQLDVETISVTPGIPNVMGKGPSEEQFVIVKGRVHPLDSAGDSDSELQIAYLSFYISMFQPDYGLVTGQPDDDGTTQHTGDSGGDQINNVTSTEEGEYVYVSWSNPTEIRVPGEEPVEVGVDIRVTVYRPSGEGEGLLYSVAGFRDYLDRLDENIAIGYALLRSIVGFVIPLEEDESVEVGVQLTSTEDVNKQTNIRFTYPFWTENVYNVPAARSMNYRKVPNLDRPGFELHRLTWEQPYWFGDPIDQSVEYVNLWENPEYLAGTFPPQLSPEGRLLEIRRHEYRYRFGTTGAWSSWQGADSVGGVIQWEGNLYASVYATISADLFGNAENLQAGLYEFEGRAVREDGVTGQATTYSDIVRL